MDILYTGFDEGTHSIEIISKPNPFVTADNANSYMILGLNDDLNGTNNHFFKVRPKESNKLPLSSEYNIIRYNGSNVPTIQLVLNDCDVYFNEHDGSYDIFTNNWVESYLL